WQPDHSGGPTAETNLAALHRGHHNLKTAGFWDSDQSADGTLTWTTATGRKVTTHPYLYAQHRWQLKGPTAKPTDLRAGFSGPKPSGN
ncbi:MAG TPA: hypothetical protein VFE92_15570, partial [Dermatophilaceae bacterium]|nr:hypothetical protein [Dermatophilaceae bacterium]